MIKLFANCTATGHYLLAATNSGELSSASLAQLAEHALRKRMVVGSIPTGGLHMLSETGTDPGLSPCCWQPLVVTLSQLVHRTLCERTFEGLTPTDAALCRNRAGDAR